MLTHYCNILIQFWICVDILIDICVNFCVNILELLCQHPSLLCQHYHFLYQLLYQHPKMGALLAHPKMGFASVIHSKRDKKVLSATFFGSRTWIG